MHIKHREAGRAMCAPVDAQSCGRLWLLHQFAETCSLYSEVLVWAAGVVAGPHRLGIDFLSALMLPSNLRSLESVPNDYQLLEAAHRKQLRLGFSMIDYLMF